MEEVKPVITQLPKKKSGFRKFLWRFILLTFLLSVFLVYWFFYNTASQGTRTVYLVKISHKGNVFKTYEGEALVSIGANPQSSLVTEKFIYSVTSKKLYDSLTKYEGQKMTLKYRQYRKTLPWRGDSEYIVYDFSKPAF
ncbi:MAG: hypothetical protein IPI66_00210 [Chitinophagaceae bacterium]|nr:hypothetical protein [Chitinophagaceae bacterium]MBL0054641.1 hypothetical protein [Chitinophagaceae bacterium]